MKECPYCTLVIPDDMTVCEYCKSTLIHQNCTQKQGTAIGAAMLKKAGMLYKKGEYQAAMETFETVIKHHPELASAYYGRALSLLKIGDKLNAVDDLRTAAGLKHKKSIATLREMKIPLKKPQQEPTKAMAATPVDAVSAPTDSTTHLPAAPEANKTPSSVNERVDCPVCGHRNRIDARVCIQCEVIFDKYYKAHPELMPTETDEEKAADEYFSEAFMDDSTANIAGPVKEPHPIWKKLDQIREVLAGYERRANSRMEGIRSTVDARLKPARSRWEIYKENTIFVWQLTHIIRRYILILIIIGYMWYKWDVINPVVQKILGYEVSSMIE